VANTRQGSVVLTCSRPPRHPARLILLHSCPCLAPSSFSHRHGAELHRPRWATPPPHWSSSALTHCIATALASSCTHHLSLPNPGIAAFHDPPPSPFPHRRKLHRGQRHHHASIFQFISPTDMPPTPLHLVHLPRARDRKVSMIHPPPSRPERRYARGPPWRARRRASHRFYLLISRCTCRVEAVGAVKLDATTPAPPGCAAALVAPAMAAPSSSSILFCLLACCSIYFAFRVSLV
jgi:hypothetical protein